MTKKKKGYESQKRKGTSPNRKGIENSGQKNFKQKKDGQFQIESKGIRKSKKEKEPTQIEKGQKILDRKVQIEKGWTIPDRKWIEQSKQKWDKVNQQE